MQDFSKDPQRDARRNRLMPDPMPAVRQDFGYRATHQTSTYDLAPGHRQQGATFDRFGIFAFEDSGGQYVELYLDDLRTRRNPNDRNSRG